jgi:hypothetical protein
LARRALPDAMPDLPASFARDHSWVRVRPGEPGDGL